MKAVFLDRDGVINRTTESGFVLKWNEFKFLPGVPEAIKLINQKGIPVIVISNQSCVGRGLISDEEVKAINDRMLKELEKREAQIDAVYFCPHAPDAGCACRKPATGLFQQAAKDREIDFASSWFIGNSDTDAEAGKRIGCRTYLLKEGEPILPAVKEILRQISA